MKKILAFFLIVCCVGMFMGCGGQKGKGQNNEVDSSAEKEDTYKLNNPVISDDNITTWDTIYFGHYWQNDTNGDGVTDENDEKEPIRWRVLSLEGNDAFLLADKILDSKKYNEEYIDVIWKTCTLRQWLNGDFSELAFTAQEKTALHKTMVANEDNGADGGADTEDCVYLLSKEEVENPKYGFFLKNPQGESSARRSGNTDYAEGQGAWENTTGQSYGYEGGGCWWLRSPGNNSFSASEVTSFGIVIGDDHEVNREHVGVRPVIHLDLSYSSEWSYAGKVTSEDEIMSVGQKERQKEKDDLGIISSLSGALSTAVADAKATGTVTITIGEDVSSLSHASASGKDAQKVLDSMVDVMGDVEIRLCSGVGAGQDIVCYCNTSDCELVVYVAKHDGSVGGDEVLTHNGVVVQNCKYNDNAPLMAQNG